jgi:hypothetical protein
MLNLLAYNLEAVRTYDATFEPEGMFRRSIGIGHIAYKRVKELIRRYIPISLKQIIYRLNEYLHDWVSYY